MVRPWRWRTRVSAEMVEQIIMSSGTRPVNGLAVESIQPTGGISFSEQVENCIAQLSLFAENGDKPSRFITQQTFFVAADSREEYEDKTALIREKLNVLPRTRFPATSVVAQPPAAGCEVVLELIVTRAREGKKVIYKTYNGLPYTLVDHGDYRVVHATGMMGGPDDSIGQAAEKAFEATLGILEAEGMAINDIIRQWNYVEDIAHVKDPANTTQNYQVFNDVRARYYANGSFRYGYPAATGIGMNTGGVIIGFVAVSPSTEVLVAPIRNPRQIDAHRYSKGMLVGRETGIMKEKCTPKFERAKLVKLHGRSYIYVSGTASIVGEESVHLGDVEGQTHTTIENIFGLFARENQASIGLDFDAASIYFSHLRVYVKHQEDISAVKAICEQKLNSKSALYLQSDICREELLVEIEGMFTLS